MEETTHTRNIGKRRMKKKTNPPPYMPLELIVQILSRLAVKSLLRFKCVCKSWLSLISHDPHFANSHFQITASTHTRKIMFITSSLSDTLSFDFEVSIRNNTVIERPNPNFITPLSDGLIEIVSSCRGFIFLHHNSSFYLWNPSTRVHKQIPLSPIELNVDVVDAYDCFYLYGFGYDQLRDDYLVVSVSFDPTLVHCYSRLEFFSLRDNTWKVLEGTRFPYMNDYGDPRVGSLFNGAIHWLAYHHDLVKNVILAFDLTERKLLEMPFLDGSGHEIQNCELWVFGEFLSLWAMDYGNRSVEIWVMEEYKVLSSWTKALVLPIDGTPSRYISPICSTKSGDIVARNGENELLKYNDEGQLLEHESYWFDQLETGFQVTMYTESLLSLPSGNVQA